METTTVRVRRLTQERLKKLSANERISIANVIDKLVDEHERFFWRGFDEEAKAFLDREEIKARKTFEKSLGDRLEK